MSSLPGDRPDLGSRQDDIGDLARQLTQTSAHIADEIKAYDPDPGSHLDPHSPSFDARAWVKALVKLAETDPEAAPARFLGVAFRNLSAYGWSTGTESQPTVSSVVAGAVSSLARAVGAVRRGRRIDILRGFEGVVGEGELLLVLGPPGSGCSTLLKTLAGETSGFKVSEDAYLNYRGIDRKHIKSSLRGEVLYNAETDAHLPHLTVGETLTLAARCRSARHVPGGFSRRRADDAIRDAMMAIFGIGHTFDTRVGDEFVRGVSGGERKRVSICEAALGSAKLQCWDNSTRGLDSGNAVAFCENLRLQADVVGVAAAVAIYQAPQKAYDQFDRVTVLYEGRQIFFGKTSEAKPYFESLGFECPGRQTVPDFLTSMTSPGERRARPGFEDIVPRSPDEFAARWRSSQARQALLQELDAYEAEHSPSAGRLDRFEESRRAEQAKLQRPASPYTISYPQQVSLALWRAYRRLLADPGFTIASLLYNLIVALLLGSMYYDLAPDTSSLYYRGGIIFFAILFNAFASLTEVLTVYAERPVVEKHNRYAFYHQSAQAIASFAIDLPYKTANMVVFNLVIYFMAGLRRDGAGPFFFFCLTTFTLTLVMSCLFRCLACATRTAYQAMVPSAILSLGLMIYTGYTIPVGYLPGWSRWMNHVNPFAYAFEALMANEFHGVEFPCAEVVPRGPGYEDLPAASRVCAVVGAVPGAAVLDGDRYINMTFQYYEEHRWRNGGILFGFLVFLFGLYLVTAEFARPPRSKGEVLVFPSGKVPRQHGAEDVELQACARGDAAMAEKDETDSSSPDSGASSTDGAVFHWEDLCYDIKVKGEERRLLNRIDGWVKPGTSTALMGVSGAGKTTLLDVLASRATSGSVSGDTLIDGSPTDASFQHRVGYVQQQDLHLDTATVREALEFSALLRQSAEIPRAEKLAHVERVLDMLDMRSYADAVVGTPGEGLNVEQRKRLSIGVELAARPRLLLFLDEPTSGLDSQTSWSVSQLIKKLTRRGQAVLCTIHQPSALLFDQFDRLLLLAPGGKTVYFGELGPGSKTLIDYFERNGAPRCPDGANQAEWMLDVVKPKTDDPAGIDWHQVWKNSPEFQKVKNELNRLRGLSEETTVDSARAESEPSQHREFVASSWTQFVLVLDRTWRHFWRSPSYIWSKVALIVLSSIYIGFSFKATNTIQGLQNQLYAIFMFLVMFTNINEQIMPMFVPQRSLYEARERPSKIYEWTTFVLSNILVEASWNTLMAVLVHACWYYPVGFLANTTPGDRDVRGLLVFLFLWMFMLFTSTFSHLAVTWAPNAEIGGVVASMAWMFCLVFCGVAIPKVDFPAFWRFMHPVSPGTYLVGGVMSAAMTGSRVSCSESELLNIPLPPMNASTTCMEWLGPFADAAGGHLVDSLDTAADVCRYCPISDADQFLARFDIRYADAWRNFGILWAYVLFNAGAAMGAYWLFRMPKGRGLGRRSMKE